MKQTKYVEIKGVKYPTQPSTTGRTFLQHVQNEDGSVTSSWVSTEEEAPDVRAAKRGDIPLMLHFAAQEVLRDLCDQMAISIKGSQGPLMGSGAIPEGHFVRTPDGFMKNEAEAARFAEDFDGDNGHDHEHKGYALFTKYPGTQRDTVKILWIQDSPDIKETFLALPDVEGMLKAEAATRYDLVEQGLKVLNPNTTGLVTTEWNVKELYEASSLEFFGERLLHLFSDYGRFVAIELNGLKGRSKDACETASVGDATTAKRIMPKHAWAFYPNRIGKLAGEDLLWLFNTDLEKTIHEILDLKVAFEDVEITGSVSAREPYRHDDDLLDRLLELGLCGYMELPRSKHAQRDGIPNPIMFWLCRPGTKYTALVDTKRGHHHRAFAYVVPPVWRRFGKTWRLLTPLQAIQMVLAEVDVFVRNPEGEAVREFPTRLSDLSKYPWLTSRLLKHIQKSIGSLGAACPAVRQKDGSIVPSVMAQNTIARTITVDFATDQFPPSKMMEGVQKLNELTPVAIAGGKGGSQRFRKYAFARANGTPEWAKETDHPRRSANQLAQLLQALDPVKYTVAIVKMRDTKSQVCITPSGIAKQRVTDVFLPRISNEQSEEYPLEQRYTGWDGRIYRCFVGKAKDTREIGKLVDVHGMKFIPRRYDQAFELTGEGRDSTLTNVDLIVPIDELEAKGCLQSWLKDAREAMIMIDGQETPCLITTRTLFRTGCSSENVPVREKTMRAKGMDRLLIWSEYLQMHPEEMDKPYMGLPVPDLGYAKEKIEACLALAGSVLDSVDPDDYDSEDEG